MRLPRRWQATALDCRQEDVHHAPVLVAFAAQSGQKMEYPGPTGEGRSEMPVPCLPMQLPSTLQESGAAEDPTIVLSGTAQIGSTPFRIVAIRVEPRLRFMPDGQGGALALC